MTLLDRYEFTRDGKVYTVEVMQHDSPTTSRKCFYAYVSDADEQVVRTRDNGTEELARKAAEKSTRSWGYRQSPAYRKRSGPKANVPEAAIVEHITKYPGDGLVEIANALGRLNGTVNKWLRGLQSRGVLRSEIHSIGMRKRVRWFLASRPVGV